MRSLLLRVFSFFFLVLKAAALPASISDSRAVSPSLFQELEELSRIVDISYCVGSSGIQKPFQCLGRCSDFAGFELVTTWNTGPLLSDSCGYIALSHPPFEKRIILAFRGTYSITNTVVDLSTIPAEYVPFPGDENSTSICTSSASDIEREAPTLPSLFTPQTPLLSERDSSHEKPEPAECRNCTVHAGFLTSWTNTRCLILPHLEQLIPAYPDYKLTLVGHSLGGAVAAIASLEFEARGWNPHVTTFGEPRVGNGALNEHIDQRFSLSTEKPEKESRYKRVTHVHDPVPLLPLEEWGYRMHAGEIFISKRDLSPEVSDLEHCVGDEDPRCIAGPRTTNNDPTIDSDTLQQLLHLPHDLISNITLLNEYLSIPDAEEEKEGPLHEQTGWPLPSLPLSPRYRLWELFFAHRDYFWRLGLCVPGGDPRDWWRKYPSPSESESPEPESKAD